MASMRFLITAKGQVINVEAIALIEKAGPGSQISLIGGATVQVSQSPEVLLSEFKHGGDYETPLK